MKNLSTGEVFTDRRNKSFSEYLKEVNEIEVLTPDEEFKIALLAQKGDQKYSDQLVKHNLRFVISLAKQYVTSTLKIEDLVNEGNYGLVLASKRFDPTKGFKFITYAVWWIRRSIINYISEHGRTVRYPTNKCNAIVKLKKIFNLLEQTFERAPTYEELVNACENEIAITKADIAFFLDTMDGTIISLDNKPEDSNPDNLYVDMVCDLDEFRTDELTTQSDGEITINNLLGLLDKELDKSVMILSFGLNGNEPLNLRKVGEMLEISSERVRQIKNRALNKMRVKIEAS